MEEIVGQVKWTTTNHTKGRSSSKEGDVLCISWDWKGVLYYELLPEDQTINSNKYCFQLDQLKAALYEKHAELVNRKRIIFIRITQDHMFLWWPGKNCYSLAGKFWFVCCIQPDVAPSDFHLFRSLQNFLNGKSFNSLEHCKRHLVQFFAPKDKKFWEDGTMKLL